MDLPDSYESSRLVSILWTDIDPLNSLLSLTSYFPPPTASLRSSFRSAKFPHRSLMDQTQMSSQPTFIISLDFHSVLAQWRRYEEYTSAQCHLHPIALSIERKKKYLLDACRCREIVATNDERDPAG